MPCQLYRMEKERGYPGGIHEQRRWKCAAHPRKVLWAMSKQVSVKWIYPSICISSCSMCRSTFQPTLVGSTSGLFSSWCLLCLLGDRFLSKRFLQVYTNSLDLRCCLLPCSSGGPALISWSSPGGSGSCFMLVHAPGGPVLSLDSSLSL